MPIFTLSISFEPSLQQWVVRRAYTIIGSYASGADAIEGACEVAIALRRRMYCGVRFNIQDTFSRHRAYLLVDDNRPASILAARLRYRYQRRSPLPVRMAASGTRMWSTWCNRVRHACKRARESRLTRRAGILPIS